MIDLHRLQLEMQRSIMSGVQDMPFVAGSDAQDRAQRLGIYASAYRSRLQEALAHNFPMLQTHLGDGAFAALANEYIDAYPSTFTSIRAFGDRLADWLATTRSSEPWLAEFASFEWSLGCAFDAPDDVAPTDGSPNLAGAGRAEATMDSLAKVAPGEWANLRFDFSRGAQRLSLSTNAAELYAEAARGERTNPCIQLDRIESRAEWLVWRQALTARYRSMTTLEALAFDALASGATFAETCARLLDVSDDDDEVPLQAAACLKRWIADELIVAFRLA